jgi:hypothetical protein
MLKITSGSKMKMATGVLIQSEMLFEWQTIPEFFTKNPQSKNVLKQFGNSIIQW